MASEFTAIIERDGDWYIAYCAEIPGANGQERTEVYSHRRRIIAVSLLSNLNGGPPSEGATVKQTFSAVHTFPGCNVPNNPQ